MPDRYARGLTTFLRCASLSKGMFFSNGILGLPLGGGGGALPPAMIASMRFQKAAFGFGNGPLTNEEPMLSA